MCEICDGKTLEETLEGMDDRIEEYGFTMQAVEAEPDLPPWVYTVGLVDGFGHPELYLRGYPPKQSFGLLDNLASMVLGGTQLGAGQVVGFGSDTHVQTHIHLDPVDPSVWDDGETFNQWWNYYGWRGEGVTDPSALEVRLCGAPPWFADVAASHGPNRAQRRAQGRHLRLAR